jgi:hypothetical protein
LKNDEKDEEEEDEQNQTRHDQPNNKHGPNPKDRIPKNIQIPFSNDLNENNLDLGDWNLLGFGIRDLGFKSFRPLDLLQNCLEAPESFFSRPDG